MAVQYRNRILFFGEAAFETLDRLGCKRNLRDQHNRSAPAAERGANRLQINFRLAGAAPAGQQDRTRVFRRLERLRDLLQCDGLFLVQNEIRSCDELLIGMWITDDRFFAQLRQAAFDQSAQGLVIERWLAQEWGGPAGAFQARDCFQEFRLPRRALSQFLEFGVVDLVARLDKYLFLPADFSAADHLG